MTKTKNPTMQNCLQIINDAIKNETSLYKASINAGKGKNYVYDMSRRLDERIESKIITKTEANEFRRALKQYQKA